MKDGAINDTKMRSIKGLAFYAIVAIFSALWSSAFVVGTIALEQYDPFTTLALRFVLSSILMAPFVLAQVSLLTEKRTMVAGGLLGLLNNAFYLGATFWALRTLRPELVVVVVSCAPFMTTLIAAALGLERLVLLKVVGIALGFVGVLVISGFVSTTPPDPFGLALAVGGTAAFSVGTVLFRSKAVALPILHLNFWQSTVAAFALLPMALAFDEPLSAPSLPVAAAIAYLAVMVTIGGMALWLVLIRISGAGTASSYHLLNPFFGVVLSHLVLNTVLQPTDFLAAAIIAAGLALTISAQERES
jgi:drug/metabolite transporter (DMT)-like permease